MIENNKNSFIATVAEFTQSLEGWVLDPNEELNKKPSGFINLLSSTLGKLNAYSYFSMLMSKNEVNASTAIRMKSLLRHLRSDTLSQIYGTPSTITFILSYPESLLIKNAVYVGNGISKLTLNRNTKVIILDKPPFTFDYNINIIINKYVRNNETTYSLYAVYDTDTMENGSMFPITNPFISTRNDIIIDGERYFTLFIPIRQYTREYYTYDLSGENKDIVINYNNHLIGFTVLYKSPSNTQWTKINTCLEGENFSGDGMSFSLSHNNGIQSLTLRYNRIPSRFAPVNGTIQVIVFTTQGADGNFTLVNDMISDSIGGLNFLFNQDITDIYQEPLLSLIPTVSLKDSTAAGGKNALGIEEVRSLVINNSMDSIITQASLNRVSHDLNFTVTEMRHDLLVWEYRLSRFLQDKEGSVVPSRTVNLSYYYSQLIKLQETDSYVISPGDIFTHTEDGYTLILYKNTNTYTEYLDQYRSGFPSDYTFPFFLRLENRERLLVEPYDLSVNETRTTSFVYITNNILDKMSIVYADIIRNPLDREERENKRGEITPLSNFYCIRFDVYTSDMIIDHLKNITSSQLPYVKFKIILQNKIDKTEYSADIDPNDYLFTNSKETIIQCTAYLETNNAILKDGRIDIINNSITELPYPAAPYQFYFIEGIIDIKIVVLFRELNNTSITTSEYDRFLTQNEIDNNYYIGIVYSIEDIEIARNLSENITLQPDIKLTQPQYKIAPNDIPDVYDEPVYKMEDGKFAITTAKTILPDGSEQSIEKFIVLHNKGDIKKELDGRIGSFDFSTGIWSDETSNTGFFDTGDILGGSAIYAMVKYNDNLIIAAGLDGRVGSYDISRQTLYPYNYPDHDDTGVVIKNNGTAMGGKTIRTMLIITINDIDVLVLAGDNGLVCSCNLETGKWRNYDGQGDNAARINNTGGAMGEATIYCAAFHEIQSNKNNNAIIFAGGSGRICSCITADNRWYGYDRIDNEINAIVNDGSAMGYKAILTMVNYLNNTILLLAGVSGRVCSCDLSNGYFTPYNAHNGIRNDGSAIGEVSIYASILSGGKYCIAGQNGRVASYDLGKGIWNTYNQEHDLSSSGSFIDYHNINAVEAYDVYIIFGCDEGYVGSFNTANNEWIPYNAGNGIRNNGQFIKSNISAIVRHASIIYFSGKGGNIVYKYRAGDTMFDETGKPVVDTASELRGFIQGIPAYDRIYAVKPNYFNIKESYINMINDIKTLSSKFPQGCTLSLGIKNTSGKSSTFHFIDAKTKQAVFLNNLDLSFKFGVRFSDSVIKENRKYLLDSIIVEIKKYIQNIQTAAIQGSNEVRLNINEMFETIKANVPNILYFEAYMINNYDAMSCQTIFWDKSLNSLSADTADEYVSLRSEVDDELSVISEQNIIFKPAVDISILNED
jgi:hypothetical protein